MKKSRYTDPQIAFAPEQAATGTPVAEVIRRMEISEQTFSLSEALESNFQHRLQFLRTGIRHRH